MVSSDDLLSEYLKQQKPKDEEEEVEPSWKEKHRQTEEQTGSHVQAVRRCP